MKFSLTNNHPMDQAVMLWRMTTNSDYLKFVNEVVEIGRKLHISNAKQLIEACETLDSPAIYELVNSMKPSSYVIAELISMVKASQKKQTAINGAKARHIENHEMKAEVYIWLSDNMKNFKSMDKAAEAIAGKIAPIAFRTARTWVSEWNKLQSAGTM